MRELKKCRACGVDIQPNAPFGHCPKCILELGFDLGADDPIKPAHEAAPAQQTSATAGAPMAEAPGDYIDRYKLLQKIGEGGCGVVYMADQEEPIRRRVALKVIKLGMDTRSVIARFEAERQALAMMDHPNIAKILDVGQTATGRPFFVMELVKGVRITEYCDQNNLPTRERLALFTQVCHAVQHAHQKGIIHRDLKPSNILVTLHDGVPVPKVIDFGIAKALHQQRLTDLTLFTAFGQFLGTPAYMSPEQAEMSGLDIDTRSDIYALGVLLYELLVGQVPFDSKQLLQAGLDEMRRIIREQEPVRPSTRLTTLDAGELTTVARQRGCESTKLTHLVRGDLDWIAMKCLEKDRTRRYETSNELAMDLARHLCNEPVIASPPSQLYRVQKFVRRNRTAVCTSSTVAAALVVGVVGSTWQWRSAVGARRGETTQRRIAETNAAESLERLVRIDVANGERALKNGDWFSALLWSTEALRQDKPGTRAEKMHRFRIGALLHYSPRLVQAWFHDAAINHAQFSPDGRWALTASRDRTARLWNVSSGQAGAVLLHNTNVSEASFSADGRRILTCSDDGSVRVWDSADGRLTCAPLEHGYRVTHALISPDGRRVFTLGQPGETNFASSLRDFEADASEVRIWDAATGRLVRPPFNYKKRISSLALSSNGQWLGANLGKSVLVWNLRQPRAIQFSRGKQDKTNYLAGLKPERANTEIETLLPEIPRPSRADDNNRWIACLAFSPDSGRIVTACTDGSVRIWRLHDGAPMDLQQPKMRAGVAERSQPSAVYFAPNGERVLLLSDDGTGRLWDARTGESEGQMKGSAYDKIWFSPDGRFIFFRNSAQVWDLESDDSVTPNLPQPWALWQSAAFSPDGVSLLTADSEGVARLWSLASGMTEQPPLKHDWTIIAAQRTALGKQATNHRQKFDEWVLWVLTMLDDRSHIAFSPDGQRVATVSQNGSARVWDAGTGAPITPYVIMDWPLEFAAFSADGARFVTVGGSPPEDELGVAQVWDALTGQPLTPVIRHPEMLQGASFSPHGQWLVLQASRSAQICDARTGEPAELPMKLAAPVRSAAFSPDGKLVAICEGAPTNGGWRTRLWNVGTGQLSMAFQETNEISRMEFSPDGRWLLTFGREEDAFFLNVRVWNVATGAHLPASFWVRRRCNPVFTRDGQRLFIANSTAKPLAVELPSGRALSPTEWRGLKMYPMAVAPDGGRFAAQDDRHLRVYDALTGEPLTPPLEKMGRVFSGEPLFSQDGSLLLVPGNKRARIWSLPNESRPIEDLVSLAQLLAARHIDDSGNFAPLKSAEASAAWQRLRAKYPDSFAVVSEQVERWREHVIEKSEKEQHWTTAAFHLNQLVNARPKDEALRLRHAQAVNQAAMEELENSK